MQARIVALGLRELRRAKAERPRELGPLMDRFQLLAAANVFESTSAILTEQGIDTDVFGDVVPDALVGWASDGRPVLSLLELDVSGDQFDRIVRTQLADTARQASAVERASRKHVTSYVRAIVPPTCARCMILAGQPSGEQPFRRHPSCDCQAVPTDRVNARGLTVDVAEEFGRMSRAEQDARFTRAGAEAIRLGANPVDVVNARRGMGTAQGVKTFEQVRYRRKRGTDVLDPAGRGQNVAVGRLTRNEQGVYTTTEGTSRRRGKPVGYAGRVMDAYQVAGPRLMPESILELASTRDEAVRLLTRYGYMRD